jgi:hypothetical protein
MMRRRKRAHAHRGRHSRGSVYIVALTRHRPGTVSLVTLWPASTRSVVNACLARLLTEKSLGEVCFTFRQIVVLGARNVNFHDATKPRAPAAERLLIVPEASWFRSLPIAASKRGSHEQHSAV